MLRLYVCVFASSCPSRPHRGQMVLVFILMAECGHGRCVFTRMRALSCGPYSSFSFSLYLWAGILQMGWIEL